MLEHRGSPCMEKAAAVGLSSTLTLRASGRAGWGGEAVFWLPGPWLVQREPRGGSGGATLLSGGHCPVFPGL